MSDSAVEWRAHLRSKGGDGQRFEINQPYDARVEGLADVAELSFRPPIMSYIPSSLFLP